MQHVSRNGRWPTRPPTPDEAKRIVPRIERVHITVSDNPSVRAGQYASIAHADAMLGEAYNAVPPPNGGSTDLLLAAVIWTDGYELRPRIYVSARLVRDAHADGGSWGLRLPGSTIPPASGQEHLHAALTALALHGQA